MYCIELLRLLESLDRAKVHSSVLESSLHLIIIDLLVRLLINIALFHCDLGESLRNCLLLFLHHSWLQSELVLNMLQYVWVLIKALITNGSGLDT